MSSDAAVQHFSHMKRQMSSPEMYPSKIHIPYGGIQKRKTDGNCTFKKNKKTKKEKQLQNWVGVRGSVGVGG